MGWTERQGEHWNQGLGARVPEHTTGGGGQEEPLLESRGQQEPTLANTKGLS